MIYIRYATIADNQLLAEIGAETFYDSFAADNTPANMTSYLSSAFGPDIQRTELIDPHSRFLIAEVAGETAGFAQLKFGAAPAEISGRQPMEIARIYARKAWIGQGVGAALMTRCLEEARGVGCDAVWLGVWERNPRAIRFYTKWGFTEVGGHTFQLGDDPQRDLLLVRSVESETDG